MNTESFLALQTNEPPERALETSGLIILHSYPGTGLAPNLAPETLLFINRVTKYDFLCSRLFDDTFSFF